MHMNDTYFSVYICIYMEIVTGTYICLHIYIYTHIGSYRYIIYVYKHIYKYVNIYTHVYAAHIGTHTIDTPVHTLSAHTHTETHEHSLPPCPPVCTRLLDDINQYTAKGLGELQLIGHHLIRVKPGFGFELVASGLPIDVVDLLQKGFLRVGGFWGEVSATSRCYRLVMLFKGSSTHRIGSKIREFRLNSPSFPRTVARPS